MKFVRKVQFFPFFERNSKKKIPNIWGRKNIGSGKKLIFLEFYTPLDETDVGREAEGKRRDRLLLNQIKEQLRQSGAEREEERARFEVERRRFHEELDQIKRQCLEVQNLTKERDDLDVLLNRTKEQLRQSQ